LVRIKPFTDLAENVAAYGAVSDELGSKRFKIRVEGFRGGMVIAALDGVSDRNAAEALKGLRLYVSKDALPKLDDDEFYHADLLGLEVMHNGSKIGTVRSIIPAGAGDVLEIDCGPRKENLLVPFTRSAVPKIDIRTGRLTVDPPEGIEGSSGSNREDETKE
tara:strand:+ start:247 stop:732 length:486 start_codon:yes stop_codon:yes gene_type:complete